MTPHMDRLAARGISFAKSYSANPVCCPARAAWFTGRHSPENGVMSNGSKLVPSMPDLGQWLRKGGYNTNMAEPEKIKTARDRYMPESGEESGMEKWEEKLFRFYIWSYYRYIEKVDGQIGLLLDSLENLVFRDNTVVILSSDHGDGHLRHKMVFKSFLYDEASRVPFIMSWPGHIGEQVIDRKHLVSGVDLFPTVCDYARITPPPEMRGYSLRPLAEGRDLEWREFVVAHASGGGTMLRTDSYKLITYENDPVIQIFDMEADPWETRNLAEDPDSGPLSRELQDTLADYESEFELAES